MPDPLFNAPGADRGSALEQLMRLRDMTRRAPAEAVAVEAVDAAPVQAFAAGAEAPVAAVGNAAVATGYVDDAAVQAGAAVAGNDPDALARAAQAAAAAGAADPAAQQVIDVAVQPRLIIQGQSGPIVVPVDVAVPAAQTRVSIAPATAVVVDPATGQAVANAAAPAAGEAAVAAPRQGFRNWGAADIGNLFRAGEAGAGGAAPVVAEAAGEAKPSLIDRIRGLGAGGAAPVAEAAAPVVAEAAGPAKPSLLDQLRGAANVARGPAGNAAPEVVDDAARGGARGLGAIGEGLSGLTGAMRRPAAAQAVEAAVVDAAAAAPSLADRALDALRVASKVNPKG